MWWAELRGALMYNGLKRNEKGFTLIELLVVISIISILASVAIPNYVGYKIRAYDADAKMSLHYMFLTCKAYWTDNGSSANCDPAIVAQRTYGFNQGPNVVVGINDGAELSFLATAQRISSNNVFSIDANGFITPP